MPNPTLDTLAAVDIEWIAYANDTYGKRNIAYPHCEEGAAKDMASMLARFKQTQRQIQPQVPVVELRWHPVGGAAVADLAGAAAQATGAVAQPAGATAQPAGAAAQSTGTAAQTPVSGEPGQGAAATVEQTIAVIPHRSERKRRRANCANRDGVASLDVVCIEPRVPVRLE